LFLLHIPPYRKPKGAKSYHKLLPLRREFHTHKMTKEHKLTKSAKQSIVKDIQEIEKLFDKLEIKIKLMKKEFKEIRRILE